MPDPDPPPEPIVVVNGGYFIHGGNLVSVTSSDGAGVYKKIAFFCLSILSAVILIVGFGAPYESNISQGPTLNTIEPAMPGGELDTLSVLEPYIAPNAFFNARYHEEPARCHPGTRERILVDLSSQLENLNSTSFVWTHGPAGVGKTAVMRTLSERLHQKGQLLSSFFFKNDPTRNSGQSFVPTLAYHFCQAIPELRPLVTETILNDPTVLKLDLEQQAQRLLVGPIFRLVESPQGFPKRLPQAIVVDGLDECDPEYDRTQIIHILNLLSDSYPCPLLIFVASRPHFDIRTHFESNPLIQKSTQQGIYQDTRADTDIRKYLNDKFDEIRRKHRFREYLPYIDGVWPSWAIVDTLVDKASGQFIFAATVIRFVQAPAANPNHRLEVLLGQLRSEDDNLRPFERLDNLYRAIFATIKPSRLEHTLDVMAIYIVYPVLLVADSHINTPSPGVTRTVATLEPLGLLLSNRTTYCQELVADLEALVEVVPSDSIEGHHTLHSFHKSLVDFLASSSRAGPKLFIPPERPWEALSMASVLHGFWHEDQHARSLMVQIPDPIPDYPHALAYRAQLNERQTTSRFLEWMVTPELVAFDYAAAAARFSTQRKDHIWHWLACASSIVDRLGGWDLPAFQHVHNLHSSSLAAYVNQSLSTVYRTHPELWALLGLRVGQLGHGAFTATRARLATDLIAALASSPQLLELDLTEGFALAHDGRLFSGTTLSYVMATQKVHRLSFGESKNGQGYTWMSTIEYFIQTAVEQGNVSVQVSRVVLSELSLRYATELPSSVPVNRTMLRLGSQHLDMQNLRMFLRNFPDHLDDEQLKLIQGLIEPMDRESGTRNHAWTWIVVILFVLTVVLVGGPSGIGVP